MKIPIIPLSIPAARPSAPRLGVRFTQSQPNDQQMDQQEKETTTHDPNQETGDVMSHSFGEGYATRSDEEGFGGVYGGNDSASNHQNKDVHESHPEYDRAQGSEVKETEKGRNQKKAD